MTVRAVVPASWPPGLVQPSSLPPNTVESKLLFPVLPL